ncbi:MAG: hypothetical protein ABIP85_22855 [Chthoniobacteraceae bacterium]
MQSDEPISEELVTLIHAISEDEDLRAWLLGLQQLPESVRRTELGGMAARMRHSGEDEGIANAVCALAQPNLFDAACERMRGLDS